MQRPRGANLRTVQLDKQLSQDSVAHTRLAATVSAAPHACGRRGPMSLTQS